MGGDGAAHSSSVSGIEPGDAKGAAYPHLTTNRVRGVLMASKGRERKTSYLPIGIALGIAVGAGFGIALDNLSLGIGPGIALGIAIALAMSNRRSSKASRPMQETGSEDSTGDNGRG